MSFRRVAVLLAGVGVLVGLGCSSEEECVAPKANDASGLPSHLSETGLFTDIASGTLAPDVRPYEPQFELWSDGATKRRWIQLPAGTQIDTSNMDDWSFPQGTRVWKEFTRDGVRVETRLLEKFGPGTSDWRAVAYVWNDDGSDATASPDGQQNARGTAHDVPSSGQCFACHGGRGSFVLGFSAIQLAKPATTPDAWDLASLGSEGRLSVAPPPSEQLQPPGNETQRAALGYLHANCGHCHNAQKRSDKPCYTPSDVDFDFWLRTDSLAKPEDTPTYKTFESAVKPGDPDHSWLIQLVSTRESSWTKPQMPPLGTEQVDSDSVELLRRWIKEM